MSDPHWPLGDELRRARTELGLSVREAARRADISEGRWRQLELGFQRVRGEKIPVKTTAETVLKVARVVDMPAEHALELAGINLSEELLAEARKNIQANIRTYREESYDKDSKDYFEIARNALRYMSFEDIERLFDLLRISRELRYREQFAGTHFPAVPKEPHGLPRVFEIEDGEFRTLVQEYNVACGEAWHWQSRATEALMDLHEREQYGVLSPARKELLQAEVEEAKQNIEKQLPRINALAELIRIRLEGSD